MADNDNIQDQDIEVNETQLLNDRIVELQKTYDSLKDQLLRKAAEFDNYKKRIENDLYNITRFANENLIEKLLVVLDDFERFLQHAQEENTDSLNDPFFQGIDLIYNKMLKILEQQGLTKMNTTGQPFDVNIHDALMVMPNTDFKTLPNIVIKEVESGYTLHDKVLRHAKVIVSGELSEQEGGAD
ncbi:MAG: nucleotide exchange factor GrpE [Bacteroidota bacterium]|nr:nucleotide exchange factor GrpE [Bacteroidota bacterium]